MDTRTVRLDCLPQGVTGFDKPDRLPLIPASRFKAACHTVARHIRGRVAAFESCEAKAAINYHAATLEGRKGSVSALCNTRYPFLAFVPAAEHGSLRLVFLPPSEISDAFAELTEFKPLDLTFLQSALASETLKALSPSELKQLRYWRRGLVADRLGDVAFSTWD